jgi:hypothetical protein
VTKEFSEFVLGLRPQGRAADSLDLTRGAAWRDSQAALKRRPVLEGQK